MFVDQYQEGVAKRGQPVTATKTAALSQDLLITSGWVENHPPALFAFCILHSAFAFECPVGRAAQAAVCKTV